MSMGSTDSQIAAFCTRWGVSRLWLFGSRARGDDTPGSDVDLLIEFSPESTASTWDWPAMQDELAEIFNARIDLLSTGVLRNPIRARSILESRRLLYAA
jgi:predicted nucleotidyltransferase